MRRACAYRLDAQKGVQLCCVERAYRTPTPVSFIPVNFAQLKSILDVTIITFDYIYLLPQLKNLES